MAEEPNAGAERTATPPPAPARPQAAPERPSKDREGVDDGNTVAPAQERAQSRAHGSADAERPAATRPAPGEKDRQVRDDAPANFSTQKGDVPDAIKRRYFSEEPQFSSDLRFYTDATTKQAAFRDTGDKLVARETNAEVIKDIVAIAQHRGWNAIEVRGKEDFRREVWMEARLAGLEVTGYKPKQRDTQELERRLDARDTNVIEPAPARQKGPYTEAMAPAAPEGRAGPSTVAPRAERPDYDKGVSGKLLEAGELPYKHRSGQELTPFVRVEQANGRQLEVWGVGLPAALERSGAKVGDDITVRRDGVEKVSRTVEVRDKETGEVSLLKREVPRNRWTIEADRFREASPAEAARDPALRDAQSRLAVVAAVVKDRHPDPAVQDRLIAGAKEKIASHIEQGAKFTPAQVREPEVAKERPAIERAQPAERDRVASSPLDKSGPERTRGR